MTQGISIPKNDYSFPNVSFTESIVGPLPFNSEWRNTIGVAGVFSRGPVGPSRINNRADYAYLFGEDNSAGALFIRQAMQQGATNFVISRVMPNPLRSAGAVSLQSGTNPTLSEAFVATGDARTVGLTFEASYIGSPLIRDGVYIGADVRVDPTQSLALSNYEGAGYFDFKVIEKLENDVAASAEIAVSIANNTAQTDLQVITATGADGVVLAASAKPGRVLRTGGSATFAHAGGAYLEILSYPYQPTTGTWAILVKGQVTGAVANSEDVTIEVMSGSEPDYFVLSYAYRSVDGSQLIANLATAQDYPASGTADGFLRVSATDKSYQSLYIYTFSVGYTQVDTGIDIAIGNAGESTATELVPTATFSVPFIRGEVKIGETDTGATGFPNTSAAFEGGLAAVEILTSLQNAIASDLTLASLFEEVTVNDFNLPYSLTFNSTFVGTESNRINYELTRTVGSGNPQDLLFKDAADLYGSTIYMTGGRNSMQAARLFLYDINGNPLVRLDALSPGLVGNSLRVTIRPIPPGQFRIEVVDEVGLNYSTPLAPESFILNNYSVDPQTGLYPETLDSRLFRAYFLPVANSSGQALSNTVYALTPQRLAPPVQTLADSATVSNPLHPSHRGVAYLSNVYFTGGSEPANYGVTNPGEQDYVDAVRRLEESDCAFISLAGVSVSDARYELAVTELTAQAERSTTLNGLRIAIVAAPARVAEARATTIASGISSDRVVIVAGYNTMVGARYLGTNSLPPIGIYAGILSNISPQVSPASISSGQAAGGVLSVDTKNTPTYLDALTRARLEVLYFDGGLRLYKFLNGITTSNDAQKKYISVRRMTDQIIMDLYRNLQWVRSAPNTRSLRSRVAAACDAYLRTLQREEKIYSWTPTICDESNNSIQAISSGKLNVRLTFTPIYPADFIRVNVVRELTTEFSVQTSPGS